MNIAILTQPLRFNYGGILQNWALQVVLNRLGHESTTLDPRRYTPIYELPYRMARHLGSRLIKGQRNASLLPEIRNNFVTKTKGKNTFIFIDKNINREEIKNYREELCGRYDAFIVGSDQVWRPKYNPYQPAMFLDFACRKEVKKIAYAASFGTDEWEFSPEETNRFKELIKHFDAVSVREESGIGLCKSFFGIDVRQMIDPTLLLDRNDYISLTESNDTTFEGDLFVSFLDENPDKIRLVRNCCSKYNLTPFFGNSRVEDNDAPIEDQVQPPLEEWIKGFETAKCIVTDSFHACVFSILFNKPFIVYGNRDRGLSRFESLLRIFGLSGQLVNTSAQFNDVNMEIDYNHINSVLEAKRAAAINFLKESLV